MQKFLGLLLVIFPLSQAVAQGFQGVGDGEELRKRLAQAASAQAAYAFVLKEALGSLGVPVHPLNLIRSEGLLDQDPLKKETETALKDLHRLESLGWAWAVSQDLRFRTQARNILLAWSRVNRGRGNPIDDTNLEPAFRAFDLVSEGWSGTDRQLVEDWFRQVANQEIDEFRRHPNRTTNFNNWNSHRIKIVGLAGLVLQDRSLLDFAVEGYQIQLARDLRPDGSSEDFEERDALHYHVYTLEPLLVLAEAFHRAGKPDLFSTQGPGGSSLEKSVQFLLPYVTGDKTHGEFVHSRVDFDRKRVEAGQKDYLPGKAFDPRSALPVLKKYLYFQPSILPLVQKLSGKDAIFVDWEMVVHSL